MYGTPPIVSPRRGVLQDVLTPGEVPSTWDEFLNNLEPFMGLFGLSRFLGRKSVKEPGEVVPPGRPGMGKFGPTGKRVLKKGDPVEAPGNQPVDFFTRFQEWVKGIFSPEHLRDAAVYGGGALVVLVALAAILRSK